MLYIILAILVFIAIIIGSTILVYYHKFDYLMIRINEAENNIDILLQKKIECISRIIPIIRENTKEKDFLDDFS